MLGRETTGEGDEQGQSPCTVDVTLIRATLRLSPIDRIRQNDRMANLVKKLRAAFTDERAR